MTDLPDPIPAATLVLMRERAGGPPELLMTERTGNMAFAAGALVFPGRADRRRRSSRPPTLARHRRRGADRGDPRDDRGDRHRAGARARARTPRRSRRCARASPTRSRSLRCSPRTASRIDATALTPFARWCPNFRETRRFDTLFFLAEAPADAPEPAVSEHEAVRAFWASAADILAEIEAGRAHAIFPTRRNLERLARFASIAEARADAARHPVDKIMPWVEERGGAPHVCIPEGIGYPVTSEPLETARRR